jgi:hypothetical protein
MDEDLEQNGEGQEVGIRPSTGAEIRAEQERAKRRRAKKAATMRKLRAEGRAS